MRFVLFILSIFVSINCFAGDSLTVYKTIPLQARLLSMDETGNIYLVKKDNSLMRLSENGDSTGFYQTVLNGDIGLVDATNPLRIVLFFSVYAKLVILDKMLAFKNELSLSQAGIPKTTAVASSADGNIWVYDVLNAKLKKIDENLNTVSQTNDLRQQLQFVPSPVFMAERDRKLYICDTANGIIIFDRYGNHVSTLSIVGVQYLQVYGQKVVYRSDNKLLSYDMQTVREKSIELPGKNILQALIGRQKLYVLYADKLVIYNLPKE